MRILIGIGIVVALIGLLFAVLNWLTARTYRPTKQDVLRVLDSVLAGKVTYQEWDEFVCVPIRHDPALEAVRLACIELEKPEFLEESRGDKDSWPGDAGFNRLGLGRIRDIRRSLAT